MPLARPTMSSKTPCAIIYKKPGTSPPVFLAGSFTEPQWQLQEMEYTTDQNGDHTFQSEVMLEPGRGYQFKLRIGNDNWVLAENYPTGDNNKEGGDAEAFKAPLFAHETLSNDTKEDSEEMKMPLFAHECLGAHDFGEGTEHDSSPITGNSPGRNSRARSKRDETSDIDVNDPTLESFPSDRGSILDAIRTIQTHLGEDQTHLEDIPLSPRVISSRRTSLDSNDDLCLSPASLSPTVTRRRESRPSHSFGRTRSLVSLGSIEEEPKPAPSKQSPGPPVVSLPNPNSKGKLIGQKSPPSEEDEAVVMKTPEVKPSTKTNGESPSQVESYEAQNTQHDKAPSATTTAETPVAANPQATDSPVNDAPSVGKYVGVESSAVTVSDPVQSSKECQPTPDSINEKKIEKTASSGDSSRNPPRGNVVPLIVTTGALALAIGIGWWQAADH
ncbi:hypothetical protein IL306_009541 [Fusarium sp. DS 682]|nr:hypothetical protein IL306_009541 [Fusarium sp. DS 682]